MVFMRIFAMEDPMVAARFPRLPRPLARHPRLPLAAAAVLAAGLVHSLLVLAAPKTQIAVYRAGTGEWLVLADDQSQVKVAFGAAGDIPVARDYEGRGQANLAVFRPSTGEWMIRTAASTVTFTLGTTGDVPVPGDYLGLGRAQA